MSDREVDLGACDREPIHIPQAIQPHGILLAVDQDLRIRRAAGDLEALLAFGEDPIDSPLARVLDVHGLDLSDRGPKAEYVGTVKAPAGQFDLFAHEMTGELILELEPAPPERRSGAEALSGLLAVETRIAAAQDVTAAANAAADGVRRITGYDRVMIYRFLEDESGQVIAEARSGEVESFLHHRYPASDIPKQARALYLRNPIRVIEDVGYRPLPIRGGRGSIDLSGSLLRSVSPVHIEYLKNMKVGASASISLVRGDTLWGLIACHHRSPKPIHHEEREMCRGIAIALDQAVRRLEEENSQREALRLTRRREELLPVIAAADSVSAGLRAHVDELRRIISADGIALVLDSQILRSGVTPPEQSVSKLAEWLLEQKKDQLMSKALSELYPPAGEWTASASGLVGCVVGRSPLMLILWFRAEEIETVNWAGNPHKAAVPGDGPGRLSPRRSFDLWAETVRGRSRAWRPAEEETARRIALGLAEIGRQKALAELNRQLTSEVADKDLLMREMHHRVQNSLQLVTSMLQIQERDVHDEAARRQLELARDRVLSVALLHRRLWRSEDLQNINLETFFSELVESLMRTWSPDWQDKLTIDVEPIRLSAHEALLIALVVSELLTNAVKYAYSGAAGPLSLTAHSVDKNRMSITVTDQGVGISEGGDPSGGFGSRLVQRLVERVRGEIRIAQANPGTSVTLLVPIAGH